MPIREATVADIPALQIIRGAVKENVLSNPALVTTKEYEAYLAECGKGWVFELDRQIAGFAIVGLQQQNIWALFVHPAFEKQGIGRQLHDTMLDWYFSQTKDSVWLGTGFQTRAENFYRKAGWVEVSTHGQDEIKFEMTSRQWGLQRPLS